MEYLMPCLCAFAACCAFSLTYNIHWKRIFPVCFGGALGWFIYLLLKDYGDVFAYFAATVVISVYAEIMARVCKVPVIVFLTTAILPLVPGIGLYRAMSAMGQGDMLTGAKTAVHAMSLILMIVMGTGIGSALFTLRKVPAQKEETL